MILNIEIKLEISPIPAKKEEEKMKNKGTMDGRKKEEMKERRKVGGIDGNGETELKRTIVISVENYQKIKGTHRDRNRVPLS